MKSRGVNKTKPIAVGRDVWLRKVNNVLGGIVILLALYMIVSPFLPHLWLWWKNLTDDTNGYHYSTNLIEGDQGFGEPPSENTLLIPKIQIDEQLVEGPSSGVLNSGIWRRPQTSTPDQGGNTVFVAHRFTYNSPASFYHLDKMDVGDKFAVFWEGEEYDYEVYDVEIVPPTAIEVEDQTEESIVTLYTCTPIWTAKNRLIVKARLYQTTNEEMLKNLNQEGI